MQYNDPGTRPCVEPQARDPMLRIVFLGYPFREGTGIIGPGGVRREMIV